jgi:hypothetical protein
MKHLTREFLQHNELYIYANNKRILTTTEVAEMPEIPLPSFLVGDKPDLLPPKIRDITSVPVLRRLNLGVISKPVPVHLRTRKDMKKMYVLRRMDYEEQNKYLEQMPKDTRVRHDTANNRVQLVGPNVGLTGCTDWMDITWEVKEKEDTKKYADIYEIIANSKKIMRKYKKDTLMSETKERYYIKDLPIMITDSNEILCIPSPETTTLDEPRIGVWGKTGFGKTVLIHGILDRAIAYWGVRVAAFNDSQSETGEWCNADPNNGMDYKLVYNLKKLDETAVGMNIVYLTPNTHDTHNILHEADGIGYKISLPFDEIITNSHMYFDLQGSSKYFSAIKDQVINCQTPEEIAQLFAEAKPTPPKQSVEMVYSIMNDLHQKKIIDRWSGVPSRWKVYYQNNYIGSYNPVIACLVAGIVPVIETSDLLNKGYFPQYFSYFARDLFNKQLNDPFFVNNSIKTWVYVDELADISRQGKYTLASDILEQLQAKGRKRGIGTIVANQNYSQVQQKIRTNVRYTFCFSTPEADKVCYDLGLDREVVERIKDLNRLEFMAYTNDIFSKYDFDGNKSFIKGPVFGTLLPPLSTHTPPRKSNEKNKVQDNPEE